MAEPAKGSWIATDGWSAWMRAEHSRPDLRRPGVRIRPVGRMALATLVVASGADEALSRLAIEHFGIEMPLSGRCTAVRGTTIVWSSPRQWLIVGHGATAAELAVAFSGIAAVTDQTDGRALIRVHGPDARQALAAGFAIDLHPRAFPAGSCAATKVTHVGVQIWLGNDDAFTISVPRSFTEGFWSWLRSASRPYGYEVETWS